MNPSVIQLLIDLADQKAKAASIALASALKNEQSTKDKSNTLHQFANQYEDNLGQKALQGMSISEYRNTRQFISNIEKIAAQQSAYIQFAKDTVAQRQADFREIEKKRLVYEILQKKQIKLLRARANLIEQTNSDELSVMRKGF
jgi:flagellar export protein FliJ